MEPAPPLVVIPQSRKDAQMRAFMVVLKRALLMVVKGIDDYLLETAN